METRIGMAGLGIMGRGMARNLIQKGFAISVWNCSPERATEFSGRATVAESPRELAATCAVVIGCVSDPPAVERVVFAEDGVLAGAQPGFRYVESSTVSPALTRRIAEALRTRGADALDAPVTGSKQAAEAGTLLFMTGGRRETHDELLPILLAMGKRAVYCGESGQGSLMKLVGNTLISFMLEGLCEGLVAAQKGGLSAETVLEVVMASGFGSPYFDFKGRALVERDFDPHFALESPGQGSDADARRGGRTGQPDAGPLRRPRGVSGGASPGIRTGRHRRRHPCARAGSAELIHHRS